jgi:serine phosphatase RsbU (regulator of sigma subunit)
MRTLLLLVSVIFFYSSVLFGQEITQKMIEGIYYGNLRLGQSVYTEPIAFRFYEGGLVLGMEMKNFKGSDEVLVATFTKENSGKYPSSKYVLKGSRIEFQLQIYGKLLYFTGDISTMPDVFINFDAISTKKEKYSISCSRIWKEKPPQENINTSKTIVSKPKQPEEVKKKDNSSEKIVEAVPVKVVVLPSNINDLLKEQKFSEAIFELHKMGVSDYGNNQYESAIDLFKEALYLAHLTKDSLGMAILNNNIGSAYQMMNEFGKAHTYYAEAKNIYHDLKNYSGEGRMILHIANACKDVLNYAAEQTNLLELITLESKLNNKDELASTYNNLAVSYINTENSEKAFETIDKAIDIDKDNNNKKGLAIDYNNKGNIYFSVGNYSSSMSNYQLSLKIKKEINDERGEALTIHNIGNVYLKQNKPDSAMFYFEKSLELAENIHYHEVIYSNYKSMANVKSIVENCTETMDYYKIYTAMKYAVEENQVLKQLSEVREKYIDQLSGDAKKMMHAIEELETDNNKKLVSLNHLQEEIRKKELVTQLELEKLKQDAELLQTNNKLLETKVEIAQLSDSRKTLLLVGSGILGLLLVLFLLITLRNAKQLKISRDEIQHQKHEIEEKNNDIIQSITYAKRLQEAILPPLHFFNSSFTDSFVLYEPKDIVAGDFYWLHTSHHNNGKTWFAAADCTGHGVPGAMVSVVCSNALNRSVKEFGLTDTGKILDKVRELVIETFEKSSNEVKDGMDIALLSLEKQVSSNVLNYSGANNPLWIIKRNEHNTDELIEIKPTKQPIGKYTDSKNFDSHLIHVQEGDAIYVFTDGFADQFGGPKGKKYMYKKMKDFLLSIHHLPMKTQKEKLLHEFSVWKNTLEQVDDVCIIGVRV